MNEAEESGGGVLQEIERMLGWLTRILLVFGTIALILMAVHVIADVVGRLAFSSPVYGTTEIVSFYYMVAAVCLPLAYMELRDEHITVDILYLKLPLLLRRIVFVFSGLVTALFFGLFAYRSWLDSLRAMATREMVMGNAFIEIWPSRYFLPIAFGLLVIVALLRVAKAIFTPAVAEEHLRPTVE
ncbi:MAG: TRAP transporter small permease [Tistlia sp.]|uniref:TRAP transporter small permease n=1 Tax=Tistlia sp. TaxID=3057121 RepID=UPI0034A2DBBA